MNEAFIPGTQKSRPVRRRKARYRFRFFVHEKGTPLLRRAAETSLFFFLCLSECFRLPSPFAVCVFSAYLLCGKDLLYPAIGILCSLGLRLFWGADPDLWQYIGLAALFLGKFYPPRAIWTASVYAACALSLRLFSLILMPTTQEAMILCTVSLMVGVLCTPAVCRAVQLADQRQSRLHVDDLLCAVVLCAVMLSGAGRVGLGPLNVGFVLSGDVILLASSIGGCLGAVSAGLLCGVSMALCGHSDGYVICFAFSGIICGLFYGRKRGVLAAVYLLCSIFSSYAIRFHFDHPYIAAAMVSSVLFFLFPERSVSAAYTYIRSFSPDAADNEAAYAQHTRAQWVGSLSAMAQKLPEVRLPSPQQTEVLEDIVTRMCEGCDRMGSCWHDNAQQTRARLHQYFIDGDRSSRMEDCPRRDAWPVLALETERADQQRMLQYAYALREREATRTHLTAIAQAMARIGKEGGQCDAENDQLRGEAEFVMRRLRISGRILYALRVSRHIRVALRYEPTLTRQKQLRHFCDALSQAFGIPMHISQRGGDIILYEETPPMEVECFHLSASAGDGNGANGDSVLTRTACGGVEIAMLSDGMGHGDQAHTESRETLELLSLCLDAGYSVSSALNAINGIMLSATDGEQYATVDLCVADLWQRTATVSKLGACPSILISGDSLRVLESSALPLGILPEIEASSHMFAFGDGDLLIQFTDGLSDACGGLKALEGQAELMLRDKLYRSPEAVCTALISAAMRRSGGVPQDDITVLCTLFKKRQTKRRERKSPSDAYSA
ncbi:MAG: SpoIIE family protein phosphatase [Clostridia bacterium]|nr:SpoIIE family protein phosphatase [Clostridia bacterium]